MLAQPRAERYRSNARRQIERVRPRRIGNVPAHGVGGRDISGDLDPQLAVLRQQRLGATPVPLVIRPSGFVIPDA